VTPGPESPDGSLGASKPPVIAFLAVTSGAQEGAIVRDMHLANAMHRRGFKVVIYWLMERNPDLPAAGIRQRVLSRAFRYATRNPNTLLENICRVFDLIPQRTRRRFAFNHPDIVLRILRNLIRSVNPSEPDPALVRRLESFLARDGVTHVLPTFAMICPLLIAARKRGRHPFDFLPTFQGEEVFASHLENQELLDDYYRGLRESAEAGSWPACVISHDYARRLRDEIGIRPDRMTVIYNGIAAPRADGKPSFNVIASRWPWIRRDIPIVTYFGRQDSEKGIDLLLYASRILLDRNVPHQLVVCGGVSFGKYYHEACRQIGRHLRLQVTWQRHLDDEFRSALYAHSRCIVYPPIHGEPFGLVAVEAMAHGTPVLVPNHGGVVEAIQANGVVGGLTFRVWDTADLAGQLEKLLTDDALHASLSASARRVARHFDVEAMTDRILAHMGLPLDMRGSRCKLLEAESSPWPAAGGQGR
jgi:glycosyltransferase involved in cell wall biosynthesis